MRFELDNLGYRWKGNYDPSTTYVDGDVVFHAGGSYYFKTGAMYRFLDGISDADGIGEVLIKGIQGGVLGKPGQYIFRGSDGLPRYSYPTQRNGRLVKELPKNILDYCKYSYYGGYYFHGDFHMMDGTVRSVARQVYGQGGQGRTDDYSRSFPGLAALPQGVKAKKVFSGIHTTYVIDNDDYLWTCGYQIYHGLNDTGNHVGVLTRIDGSGDIPAGTKFKFAGQVHDYRNSGRSFAVTLDGHNIYNWGYNYYGCQGVGNISVGSYHRIPKVAVGLPSDIVIDKVYAMGGAYPATYIIDENGILYTAGDSNASFHGRTVYEFTKFHPWGEWNANRKVVHISATENQNHSNSSYYRVVTITFANGDYFWRSDSVPSSNYFGQVDWNRPIGAEGDTPENTNVKEAVARNGGYMTHWVFKNDGSVWSKGYNGFNVHDGNSSNGTWNQWEFPNVGEKCIKFRASGADYLAGIGVLSNYGRIYMVGHDYEGFRGRGTYNNQDRPASAGGKNAGLYPILSDKVFVDFQFYGHMADVYSGSDADGDTAAGVYALTDDGEVYCWGYGGYSMLGDDDAEYRTVPGKLIF